MGINRVPLASVLNMAALPADLIHAAFDDEQVFSAAPHQNAGKPPLMVKRQLVQLGMPLFQFPVMALLPRHFPVPQDRIIQMVLHTRMVEAVEIGQIQGMLALVPQDIHIVFQGNLISGQGAGFVNTQDIHASKPLHGVDIFDHRLFFFHRRTALCQTGIDHHREHFRGQAHSNRKRKQKGGKPVALGQAASDKDNGDQNRHKSDQNPRNRICAPVKAIFQMGFHR